MQALADFMKPVERLSVAQWAERHRVVAAESGSRYPGEWKNDRAPHLVGIMDALGPDDPAEDVVFVKSAQVGGSEVGINFFGFVVAQDPGPMITVLPSQDESIKYVRTKMQPAIDASPVMRARVLEMTSRTERGSTASFKKFRGGFNQVTFAGSSKGLQMLSARYTLGDEVSEWPAESGERGDPVAQLKVRTKTFERDRKRFWVSTPALAGSCRITGMFDDSDRCRRYVPCPHCGAWQVLTFAALKWDSDVWPHRAWFQCLGEGCVIEHVDKGEMLDRAVWIATAPVETGRATEDGTAETEQPPPVLDDGDLSRWLERDVPRRARGFHIWQAYSKMESWDSIVAEYLGARENHERMRVFTQQVLGEAWEDQGDAPDSEALHKARVLDMRKGRPPTGPVVFTGATDVQGNRLEWAVWGWSEGMTRWLVDWGVIEGDPHDVETWVRHDDMVAERVYSPGGLGEIRPEAWAIDTGYATQMVYNYTRGRARVFGVDGRDGRTEPYIGAAKKVDVRLDGRRVPKGATLWPVGTFALKADLYAAIRKSINGPDETGTWRRGAMILPGDVPLAYCEQLTAEHLVRIERASGVVIQKWEKLRGRPNEALDIAGYARAMAAHLGLDRLTAEQWAKLRAERCPAKSAEEMAQRDLFECEINVDGDGPTTIEAPRAPVSRKRRLRGRVT